MQSDNGKHKDKNEGHDNKECIEPTFLSRWGKQIEEKSREEECCYVTHEGNHKQGCIPASITWFIIKKKNCINIKEELNFSCLWKVKTNRTNQNCSSYPTHVSFQLWTKSNKRTTCTRRNNPDPNFDVDSAANINDVSLTCWNEYIEKVKFGLP